MALILLRYGAEWRLYGLTGQALAVSVTLIGLGKLSDLLVGTAFQLDQAIFRDRLSGVAGLPPNRMAPNTALDFILLGTALLALRLQWRRGVRPAQWIALLPTGLALVAVLGYALDVKQLYGLTAYIPMALNTAITFGVLAVAILFAHPETGITRVFLDRSAGGTLARRVIPCALIVPALLAWLHLHAQHAGLVESAPALSVVVFSSSALLAALVWFTATRLSRAERERTAALDELKGAHDILDQRVRERTSELLSANEQLTSEIEERQLAERALRDSEGRYRLLFLGNPHPMWVYDAHTLGFLARPIHERHGSVARVCVWGRRH